MKRAVSVALALAACASFAQDDRPVVQIPGRSELERPAQTTVLSPAIIQVQTPPRPAAKPAPADETGGIGVPVGTILAWANAMTNLPPLPRGWVACNGQLIDDADSLLVGQTVPNLNAAGGGDGRFLRGASRSGGVGGAATHAHAGYNVQKYGTQRSPVAAPVPANNLPPYFDVLWIMRIK